MKLTFSYTDNRINGQIIDRLSAYGCRACFLANQRRYGRNSTQVENRLFYNLIAIDFLERLKTTDDILGVDNGLIINDGEGFAVLIKTP